jgi:hypothetical protein
MCINCTLFYGKINKIIPWKRVLQKLVVAHLVTKLPPFNESEVLLSCSQQPSQNL